MRSIDELVILSKDGHIRAKEELVNRLKPLILSSIKKYYKGNLDFDDLVGEGNLKVISEVERFEIERKVPFLGYIKLKLKYHYLELSRKKRELLTLNISTEEGSEILDFIEDSDENTENKLIYKEDIRKLIEGMNKLTQKQRLVLELVYFKGHTMKKTANILGLHYQTIIAIKNRGVERLKKQLRVKS